MVVFAGSFREKLMGDVLRSLGGCFRGLFGSAYVAGLVSSAMV